MIIESEFEPIWWLANPHLQTMWPALARSPARVALHNERLELPDGDFLKCTWTPRHAQGPIVVILHGLGGSANSVYAKAMLHAVSAKKWTGVLMHFRGAGGEPNRLLCSYHSGKTDDIAYFTSLLKRRYPDRPIFVVGYSLGGNVLLKWMGESEGNNPVAGAAAISVPFDLALASNRMSTGWSRVYQRRILRGLLNDTRLKADILKEAVDVKRALKVQELWEFDALVTAPIHGFSSVDDYYSRCSAKHFLSTIKTPTFILHAKDDPFMTQACIPTEDMLSDHVTLELSKQGGHVGFVAAGSQNKPKYVIEDKVLDYFTTLQRA